MGLLLEQGPESKTEVEHLIKTNCKDCIFATWDGTNQRGCEFARLERFEANGGITKVSFRWVPYKTIDHGLEYGDELADLFIADKWVLVEYHNNQYIDLYDDTVCNESEIDKSLEISYYAINRFCNYCRNIEWAKEQKDVDLKKNVVEENKLEFTWVVYIDKTWKLNDLISTTQYLRNLGNHLILVDNQSGLDDSDVCNTLNHTNLPWRRVYIVEKDAPMNFSLDESYKWIKTQFFGEIRQPISYLPDNIVEEMDISINVRLERILAVSYKKIPGFNIFYTKLVKLLSGNKGIQFYKDNKTAEGVFNKLKYFADEQNAHYLIKEYE